MISSTRTIREEDRGLGAHRCQCRGDGQSDNAEQDERALGDEQLAPDHSQG